MAEFVLVEKSQGVAILTMNRPQPLNAMNQQLSAELHDAVMRMGADDEVGCLVITGSGTRAFSAGGDIHEQREDDQKCREAAMGVKALLLEDLGGDVREPWANERNYTTKVVRGAKAESAFPEFIARKGRARA